jgi:hypothetical protein
LIVLDTFEIAALIIHPNLFIDTQTHTLTLT